MKFTAKQVSRAAVVAALYAALCFFFKPLSYGSIQLRISEALCVLPAFMPEAIPGLFIGCIIANLTGGSSVALIDMILGSITSLIAALLTRRIFKKTQSLLLALLPPVVLNALIVGSYVPFIYSAPGTAATPSLIFYSILTVGIGQALVMCLLALPFGKTLQKTKFFKS